MEGPPSSAMSGEYLETIKHLAHDHFIQLEMGTTAEFEKLWREAFSVEGTTANKASGSSALRS